MLISLASIWIATANNENFNGINSERKAWRKEMMNIFNSFHGVALRL
ncbi:MAG: hypothetical protein Q8K92_07305 [Leadbetterella sp.]|nr:hypothetical protein [Leadbetterella sp.]